MVRIITPGKPTKFTKTCEDCGCVFEYELEDLFDEYSMSLTTYPPSHERYIKCPCCGKKIYHDTLREAFPKAPDIIYCNHTEYDCSTCPNKPDPNNPIAGDTPCTWCPKMQPKCVDSCVDMVYNGRAK